MQSQKFCQIPQVSQHPSKLQLPIGRGGDLERNLIHGSLKHNTTQSMVQSYASIYCTGINCTTLGSNFTQVWFTNFELCLQCFDKCCWLGGGKSTQPVKNLSDAVLAWLSVWSNMQITCIWFSWCHCHPIISVSAKSRMAYPSGTGLIGLSWKKGH